MKIPGCQQGRFLVFRIEPRDTVAMKPMLKFLELSHGAAVQGCVLRSVHECRQGQEVLGRRRKKLQHQKRKKSALVSKTRNQNLCL